MIVIEIVDSFKASPFRMLPRLATKYILLFWTLSGLSNLNIDVWNRSENILYLYFYCYTRVAVQNKFVLSKQSGHL